jgi:hypothetical protein
MGGLSRIVHPDPPQTRAITPAEGVIPREAGDASVNRGLTPLGCSVSIAAEPWGLDDFHHDRAARCGVRAMASATASVHSHREAVAAWVEVHWDRPNADAAVSLCRQAARTVDHQDRASRRRQLFDVQRSDLPAPIARSNAQRKIRVRRTCRLRQPVARRQELGSGRRTRRGTRSRGPCDRQHEHGRENPHAFERMREARCPLERAACRSRRQRVGVLPVERLADDEVLQA